MDLKTYFSTAERGEAARVAKEMEISASYLSQMISGASPISPARAVQFEQVLAGSVKREDIYPDEWHLIWPELVTKDHPAPTKKAA